jgi:hypothetical protein
LNESLNESVVSVHILTEEEQHSLNSNKDLVDAIKDNETNEGACEKLDDPRSPTNEIERTPIVAMNDNTKTKKNCEDKLMKKITEKIISTKISTQISVDNENSSEKKSAQETQTKRKGKLNEKNLIFEDDEENFERFSTPPKKSAFAKNEGERTPLGCLGNSKSRIPHHASGLKPSMTSTPKGTKIPVSANREKISSSSRIPRRKIEA